MSAINSKLPIIVFLDDWYVVIDFVVRVVCLWKLEGTALIPVSDGLSMFSFFYQRCNLLYITCTLMCNVSFVVVPSGVTCDEAFWWNNTNTIIVITQIYIYIYIYIYRVGFLPEETYFFQDTRIKVEETYFFLFCPDKTGRNWTKLEKTMKAQKCWKNIIIKLNYLQKIIMIMVTNAFG